MSKLSKDGSFQRRRESCQKEGRTPSKRDKYDSYTPRKRYIKEQQQYDTYRNQQIESIDSYPFPFTTQNHSNLYPSNEQLYQQSPPIKNNNHYECINNHHSNFDRLYPQQSPPLSQVPIISNCVTSVRKNKLRNYQENKQICKKINFEQAQNTNKITPLSMHPKAGKENQLFIENRQKFKDIQNDFCLTPRRLNNFNPQDSQEINSKLSNLQAKIARLQRMTPKKYSKSTQINPYPKQSMMERQRNGRVSFGQRQATRAIQTLKQSIKQRESGRVGQLMRRVSLGRLVEQDQIQGQAQIMHDLSQRISYKLKSIIRNFGCQ